MDRDEMLFGLQIRATRSMLRRSAHDLSNRFGVSYAAIARAEAVDGMPDMHTKNLTALKSVLEDAGVEFIAENGGGAGVRLRKGAETVMKKKFEIGDSVKQHDNLPVDLRHAGETGVIIDPGRKLLSASHICVRWPNGEECEYGDGRFVLASRAVQLDEGLHPNELNASNDD